MLPIRYFGHTKNTKNKRKPENVTMELIKKSKPLSVREWANQVCVCVRFQILFIAIHRIPSTLIHTNRSHRSWVLFVSRFLYCLFTLLNMDSHIYCRLDANRQPRPACRLCGMPATTMIIFQIIYHIVQSIYFLLLIAYDPACGHLRAGPHVRCVLCAMHMMTKNPSTCWRSQH